MVIPIRQALQSYNRHQDKIGAYIDMGRQYLASAQHHLTDAIVNAPTIVSSLEQAINNLC